MAAMILLAGSGEDRVFDIFMACLALTAVLVVLFVLFLMSGFLARLLGKTGINVITRLLGMLLAALSVQYIINGLIGLGVLG